MTTEHPEKNIAANRRLGSVSRWVIRSIAVVVFGPVVAIGCLVAVIALAQEFFAGWIPTQWIIIPTDGESVIDLLFGGNRGSAARYLTTLVGVLAATGASNMISRAWRA